VPLAELLDEEFPPPQPGTSKASINPAPPKLCRRLRFHLAGKKTRHAKARPSSGSAFERNGRLSNLEGFGHVAALAVAVTFTVAVPLALLLKSTVYWFRASPELMEQEELGAVVVQER